MFGILYISMLINIRKYLYLIQRYKYIIFQALEYPNFVFKSIRENTDFFKIFFWISVKLQIYLTILQNCKRNFAEKPIRNLTDRREKLRKFSWISCL